MSVILQAYLFLAAMLLFIVLFTKPQWGLYVLIFTVPPSIGFFIFQNKLVSPHLLETVCSIPLDWLFLFLIIPAWFVRVASKPRYKKHIHPNESFVIELLFLFICWNAVTLFWTPNLFVGFIQFIKLLVNVCIFSLFYYGIDSQDSLKRVTWAWLLLGLILFVLSFFSIYGIDLAEQVGKSRFVVFWRYSFELDKYIDIISFWKGHLSRGTAMMSYNALPFVVNLIIAVALGLLLATKREEVRKRFVVVIILILLVGSNLISQSKGGLVGLFAMIFYFLIIVHRLRSKFIRNSFIFVTATIALYLLIRYTSVLGSHFRYVGSTTEFSLLLRLEWWQEMIGLLFQKTMGIGLGVGGSMFYLDPVPYIHSIYFSVLCDTGVIGVLLVSLIVGIIVREALPIIKYQKTFLQYMLLAYSGGLIAIGVHGLVDFHYNYPVIWMFIGTGMAVLRLAKQELAEGEAAVVRSPQKTT